MIIITGNWIFIVNAVSYISAMLLIIHSLSVLIEEGKSTESAAIIVIEAVRGFPSGGYLASAKSLLMALMRAFWAKASLVTHARAF